VKKRYNGGLGIFAGYHNARFFAIFERFGCIGLPGDHNHRGAGFRRLLAVAAAKVASFEGWSKNRCSYGERR
jgi:hypothetical protein